MPEPVGIRDGDIVQVDRAGLYYARVAHAGARDLVIQPLDPRVADRRVRLTEIRRVFRDVGAPGGSPLRVTPSPRQLRFDELDETGR